LVLTCSIARVAPAEADDVAAFYKGKNARLIISTGTGGGYDAYGRLLAQYLGRHIPGTPNFVPQNMTGAGGIRATNFMYHNAPKDGSVIAVVHSAMTTASLLTPEKVEFDSSKLNWIGNMDSESSLCVSWHTSPIKTTQDMLTKQFIVGGSGAGSNMEIYPRVINEILGAKIKVISGYKGGKRVALAMEQGELQGRCSWPLSAIRKAHPDWLKSKKLNLLLQTGLEKNPELPNVPLIVDFVKNDDDRAVVELIFAARSFLRPVLAPPNVPAERIAALRNAFDATVADKKFQADAERRGMPLSPIKGQSMQGQILKIYRTPKSTVERARKIMGSK
jgi:tripartite-type tricarboxylate transporter receptor subunit TctC